MSKSKNLPECAMIVRTYREMEDFARAFADGFLNLLGLIGPPGTGKSHVLREAVGKKACWINGNASPFGIYKLAYKHADEAIVLDDVDGLCRDRQGVRLLKTLCQTDASKSVSWETDAPALDREGIPRCFQTSSPVAIIANQWRTMNLDVAALEDRGHIVSFEPSPLEVHRRAATFFGDQEVFDFVRDNLHLISSPSLRTYVLAAEQKYAGLDWKQFVLSRCLSGTALVVARLKTDPQYATEDDRIRKFVQGGHGCRATYFNHARQLQATEPCPNIPLANTATPAPALPLDLVEIFRRRGELGKG